MDVNKASIGFAAIGASARLHVLKLLVRSGPVGMTVGDIQTRSGIAASTLAHHLKMLVDAGLISQIRVGRSTQNTANFENLEALAQYILSECCADASQATSSNLNELETLNGK